ncbi:MAG: prolyl oligopeptidase family serine peptidase [Stackebrandtia sp.]
MSQTTVGAVTFSDPHRRLRADSAEALEWQWDETAAAVADIHGWEHFDEVHRQLAGATAATDMLGAATPRRVGRYWFRLAPVSRGAKAVGLWVSESATDPGRVLVDPGESQVLWYEPSRNGTRVVYGAFASGEGTGTLRAVETESAQAIDIEPLRLLYTGAVPGWLPGGDGFYVHDLDDAGGHLLRFVSLGAETEPEVGFGREEVGAQTYGLTPQLSPNGRHVIVLTGQHEQLACHISDRETGRWRRFLPSDFAGECHGVWLDDATYVAVVTEDTPRGRVVAIPVATSDDRTTWRTIVEESDAVVRCLTRVGDDIVLCELRDAAAGFRIVTATGRERHRLGVPDHGYSPTAAVTRRFDRADALTFEHGTFDRAPSPYTFDGELTAIGQAGARLPGLTVARRTAVSRDGTRVPYHLVYRGDLTGPRPALLCAYGGFNVAWLPRFLGNYAPFLAAGGIYVHAQLRGGAEYGRDWYENGRLKHKRNTFDDLFAVAEQLRDGGTADRLAFHGHSNGGMVAGVAAVLRPELWHAVVADAPLLDMMEPFLSDGQSAAAVRSVFGEDYGDLDDPVDSRRIYAYSPYHNVRDGVEYPAVLQMFGENDQGCPPFHGRVFTARMREATGSGNRVLLRVRRDAGHVPMTTEESREHHAELLSFVMRELGMAPGPRLS